MVNKTEFIRVEKTSNYSIIHNGFLRRSDLSWKAKGILTYILQLPDEWNINLNELMRHATDGESSFKSGWKELKDAGYIERRPVKDPNSKKITHWETIVRENVDISTSEPQGENPPSGKPTGWKTHSVESHSVENQQLLNTNNTNNLELSTNNTNEHFEGEPSQASHCDTNVRKSDTEKEIEKEIDTESDSDLKKRFESLWSIYPNKKGKQPAFRHYKAAIKDGVKDDEIKKGIEAYSQEIESKGTSPQYVKHGSTFFSQRAWEDDYTAHPPKQVSKFAVDAPSYEDYEPTPEQRRQYEEYLRNAENL